MSRDLILGFDPGMNGAAAVVELGGDLVEVFDLPTLQLKNKRELDAYRLASLIDAMAGDVLEAWIEQAWPRPGEGGPASFKFGAVYGEIRGIIQANFIPLHTVPPVTWKRTMKVAADKDEARLAASTLWPQENSRWPNKGHHGRAEAALIADYGRRQFQREHGAAAA
jgi:hypothetical protein